MDVTIKKLTDWKDVLDAARFTVNKEDLNKEPSILFKNDILMSQHSPIRALIFQVDLYGIKSWVSQHVARHDAFASHETHFVGTSREDLNPNIVNRDDMPQGALVNHRILLNAEDFINISRKRLCNKAHNDTIKVWRGVLSKLHEIEPELASKCVKECVYRGFCPFKEKCGFYETDFFVKALKRYRNNEM